MPRGKRPAPRPQTQSEKISAFAGRIEQVAPAWLEEFVSRRRVLLERFHQKHAEDPTGVVRRLVSEVVEDPKTASKLIEDIIYELFDVGKASVYLCSPAEQSRLHQALSVSESDMMKFAALREQHLKAKGLSAYVEREGQVHNHLTLNYAPGMTQDQRAYAERLLLASVSGKEVEAPAEPKIIEAQVA